MLITLLIICVVIFIVLSWSLLFYRRENKKCKIPGPHQLPIVGNAHRFAGGSTKILQIIPEFIKEYGDIVRVFLLLDRFVLLAHPKYIEIVLSNNDFNTKADSYIFLHSWLGQGLLTAKGHRWRTHRKFLTPSFHFDILKTFLPIFLKNDEIFIKKLENVANGQSFDVFPLMALLALDNISESAMGVCVNAQGDSESKYVKAVNDITEIIFNRMTNILLWNDFLFKFTPLKKIQDKALSILHGQTTSVIKSRRKLLEESNTTLENYDSDLGIIKKCAFLDLLLLSSVEGQKLNDDTIREEVDTFMFEGHDTTTSGLSFTLYCISRHNDVKEKLFKEQEHIFGGDLSRHPTYTDLNDMKYLEAVIKESLRLYPSVPMIARKIVKDTYIDKYFLPKETTVLISLIHMQRSPNIFEDPLAFKPERFRNITNDQRSAYSWIAFSAGPRNCIGQKFAMLEMKTVLSSVIRRFHILPSNIEPVLCADLILRSQNGVQIKLLPR